MSQMERIPPHSDEAEKSVLGASLIDKDTFFAVTDILKADDFYTESHKEIFLSMMDLYARSEPIDVVTVSESLKRRNSLEAVGGRAYIAFLSTVVPTTANAVQYARIVAEKAMLRRLITAAGDIVEKSYEEKLEPDKVVDYAEATIFDVAKTKQTTQYSDLRDVLAHNLEEIKEARENGGRLPGIPTHFKDLDKRMNGLHKSDLIIIGENTSEGNTFGKANFSTASSANSPGSASALLQQYHIFKRFTSHSTAGELYLDGHARHVKPQQTFPSKEGALLAQRGTTYGDLTISTLGKCASTAWGSWTDCNFRKAGNVCSDDTTCRKK